MGDIISMGDSTQAVEKNKEEKKTAKKKDDPKTRPKPKYAFAKIETELSEMIDGLTLPLLAKVGQWPHRFEVVRLSPVLGPIILEHFNNAARVVSIRYLGNCLKNYVKYLHGKAGVYNITRRQCEEVALTWSETTKKRRDEMPPTVGFKSTPGLVMHRHDFDPPHVSEGEIRTVAPTFGWYIDHMTNSEAFCQRVGSISDPKCARKQALWVYGPANCGKSQIAVLLQWIVGTSYVRLDRTLLASDYWKAELAGKRLAIVNEAPLRFITSDSFKEVTGDEYVTARRIYGDPFEFRCDTLIAAFSNDPPAIPNDDALKDRLISCFMKPVPKENRLLPVKVQAALKKELPYIIGYCIDRYRELGETVEIPCDSEILQESIDIGEGPYLDFIEAYIAPKEGGFITRAALQRAMEWDGIRDGVEQAKCKAAIFSRYDCKEGRPVQPDGTRPCVIVGVRLKTTSPVIR